MGEMEKLWCKDLFELFLSKSAKNGKLGETEKLYIKDILKVFGEKLTPLADAEPALAKDIWTDCLNKVSESETPAARELWAGLESAFFHTLDTKFAKIDTPAIKPA